jgi:hypothetical protein
MKIICLNLWAGKCYDDLVAFLNKHKESTDVFCFQEVFDSPKHVSLKSGVKTNLYTALQKMLDTHDSYFAQMADGVEFDGFVSFPLRWGLSLFIKKGLKVGKTGSFFIYQKEKLTDHLDLPRVAQYCQLYHDGEQYTICHAHGLVQGITKEDLPDRLIQSQIIKDFLASQKGHKILCGDFNLLPHTKSITMLSENMRNLIAEFKVASTRTKHFPYKNRHADYMFISPKVALHSFSVLQDVVSDHYPLELLFD